MATYSAGSATIDISPSLKSFASKLRGELERIQAEYTVDVEADVSRARTQLEELARDRNVTVRVDLDHNGAEARLDELARDRQVNVNVDDRGGLAQVSRGADNAGSSLSRMGAIKFGALAGAITALVPALVGVVGAASAAGGAIAAIGGTGAVGFSGIGDAFKAMKAQSDSAGSSAQDMADKVQDAAQSVVQAHQDVRRAQEGVVDAQREAKSAQDDLNDSYEKASRNLRDMNDQLADAQLSQESAEIALARAQESRAKAYSDPRSTSLDRAEADLRVKEAGQRLKESKSKAADQRSDTAEANAKGVGGSDIVQGAQQNKIAADQKLVSAQDTLANSQAALAKATRELAEAQKSGGAAADKYAEALAKLSPNAREFVQQMKALGPEWRNLKNSVQDKMFDGLGASVTQFANQNLAGLRTTMTGVAGYMNTTFKTTLTDLSGTFAKMSADGTMQRFVQGVGGALQGVSPMINGFTKALVDTTAIAGPAMGTFFKSFGDMLGQTGPTLGGIGRDLLNAFTPLMPVFGDLVKSIGSGLGPALGPLGDLFKSLMQSLAPLAKPLGDFVSALAKDLAPILPTVASGLKVVLGVLSGVLDFLGPTGVGTLLTMAATIKTIMVAVEGFKIAMAALNVVLGMNPIGLVVTAIAALAAGLIYAYNHSETFREIVHKVWEFVKDAIVGAWNNFIKPALDALGKAWGWLVDKARDMREGLKIIWKSLQDDIGDVKDWIVDKWNSVLDFFKGLPGKVTDVTKGLWDGMKNAAKSAFNMIAGWWNDTVGGFGFKVPSWIPRVGGKEFKIPAMTLMKADGGPISGPGGPRSDLIPAMLSNGEYVINSAAVAKYGTATFDRLNSQRFADGGQVGAATYGLPGGTSISYGQSDQFPDWVRALEAKFGVKASTYPGHQESNRNEAGYAPNPNGLNRGIDFSGSVEQMQAFAEYLQSIAASTEGLEQIIWENPNTGQKIGWHGRQQDDGSYFASDYSGHRDHVHLRASAPIGAAGVVAQPAGEVANGAPATVDGQNVDGAYDPTKSDSQDGRSDPQKYTPQTTTNSTTSSSTPQSWGDVVGLGAKAFASGMVNDALGVFGIPTSLPPIVSAFLKVPGQLQRTNADGSKTPVFQQSQGLLGQLGLGWQPAQASQTTQTPKSATTPTPSAATATTQTTPQTTTPTPAAPAVEQLTSTLSAPAAGYSGGSQAIYDAVYKAFREAGFGADQWDPLVQIVNRESTWNPMATNPNGGAYGLFQFLGSTKDQYLPDSSPDPYTQGKAGMRYIKDRYGTPASAWATWQTQGWYRNGGLVGGYPLPGYNGGGIIDKVISGSTLGPAGAAGGLISGAGGAISDNVMSLLSHGEYVVNAVATGMNLPVLEAINQGKDVMTPLRQLATQPAVNTNQKAAAGNHWNPVYQIQTDKIEDAFLAAQRRDNQDRAAQLAIY